MRPPCASTSPSARLEAALPIMADVALRPTFPQAELDRLRQERLTALIQARDDAAQVAPLAFARVVFGGMHRYGTAAMGTPSTLKAFTTMDLRAFHSAMYQPVERDAASWPATSRADTIVAASREAVRRLEGRGPAARTPVPQAPQLTERQVTIVDMPGAEQSQVRIGWVGVPRSTPDYFTLQVLNTILGGSFTSRLNQNLREKNQFSYGASSRFDMRLAAGPFFAGAGIQTDKTADALREFFNELNAIAKPVSAEELSKAKNYIALGFPSGFETIRGSRVATSRRWSSTSCPTTTSSGTSRTFRRSPPTAVQKAAATYIQPGKFAVVIAGDRKAIEAGVRGLKLGPVRVLSGGGGTGVMSVTIGFEPLLALLRPRAAKWQTGSPPIRSGLSIVCSPAAGFPRPRTCSITSSSSSGGTCAGSGRDAAGGHGVPAGDWQRLFEYADLVRADFAASIVTLDGRDRRRPVMTWTRVVGLGPVTMSAPPARSRMSSCTRFAISRNWRCARRAAGIEPPGNHDLFLFEGFD